jgi:Spy/CpxP family protein refolding chaperone
MKQRKSRIAGVLALSVLLGATTAAWAFGGKEGCRRGPMQAIERLDGISDEQKSQVEALFQDKREKMKLGREERKAIREEMKSMMSGSASDEAVQQTADKVAEQARQRVLQRAAMQKQLATILTPEQMEQLQQMRMERMKGGHHGKYGHGRWGDDDDGKGYGRW